MLRNVRGTTDSVIVVRHGIDVRDRIGVVGIGTLGVTIAQLGLDRGGSVVMIVRPGAGKVERAEAAIDASIEREVRAGRVGDAAEMRARAVVTDDLAALRDCPVVVESVIEDIAAKQAAVAAIEPFLAPTAVIASATSTIPAATIGAGAARPDRIVVAHYVWPANRVRLVEFAAADDADPAAVSTVLALLDRQEKTVVRARDVAGFLITRVVFAYWNEMIELLCEGWSPSELDAALEAAGWPMGPCRLVDRTSLTTPLPVLAVVGPVMQGRADAIGLLAPLVAAGHCGVAAGRGLYEYTDGDRRDHAAALAMLPRRPRQPGDPVERLVDALANEAGWCVSEGVVAGWDDAALGVDAAYGFPGGLLAHVGDGRALRARLQHRAETIAPRFTPSPAIAADRG